MDVNQFLTKTKPSSQRSRLAPYWNEIIMLRERGYSLMQICEFLAENGVQISHSVLARYIKRRQEKGDNTGQVPAKPSPITTAAKSPLMSKGETPTEDNLKEDFTGKSQAEIDRARRECIARQYIKPEDSNPLIKKFLKKDKPQ